MSHILFFALKEDLLPVLEAVESKGALKYVRTGIYLRPEYEPFHRGADIPNLGRATSESGISSASFLVCDPEVPVNFQSVALYSGGTNYHIDQLVNPDTITFTPGGLWTRRLFYTEGLRPFRLVFPSQLSG